LPEKDLEILVKMVGYAVLVQRLSLCHPDFVELSLNASCGINDSFSFTW